MKKKAKLQATACWTLLWMYFSMHNPDAIPISTSCTLNSTFALLFFAEHFFRVVLSHIRSSWLISRLNYICSTNSTWCVNAECFIYSVFCGDFAVIFFIGNSYVGSARGYALVSGKKLVSGTHFSGFSHICSFPANQTHTHTHTHTGMHHSFFQVHTKTELKGNSVNWGECRLFPTFVNTFFRFAALYVYQMQLTYSI